MVRPDREALGQRVAIDEAFVGSKHLGKAMVLVAKVASGRVRLAHVENNDEVTLKWLVDTNIAGDAAITTDGLASYNPSSFYKRRHVRCIQTPAERSERDALQGAHWSVSVLKRWLLGIHGGAVKTKHLQSYLDEVVFRYNRRRTNGVARIAARTIEQLVARPAIKMRQIIDQTRAGSCPSRISRDRHDAARPQE